MNRYVYVARSGDFTKIGVSRTPVARLNALKYKPAKLVYALKCRDARAIEQLALMYLAASSIGGEYLDCKPGVAIAAVKCSAVELEGSYEEIVDAEPDRWALPVDNSAKLDPAPMLALRELSP